MPCQSRLNVILECAVNRVSKASKQQPIYIIPERLILRPIFIILANNLLAPNLYF